MDVPLLKSAAIIHGAVLRSPRAGWLAGEEHIAVAACTRKLHLHQLAAVLVRDDNAFIAHREDACSSVLRLEDEDTRTLADQEVVDAFTAYALDLIQRFQPACLNFAIEVSELAFVTLGEGLAVRFHPGDIGPDFRCIEARVKIIEVPFGQIAQFDAARWRLGIVAGICKGQTDHRRSPLMGS